MAAKQKRGRGRPKINAAMAYTQRHVVNISVETEQAVQAWATDNGIGRMTDALRQLIHKGLKADGRI